MAISFDQYQQIIKESGPAFIKELKKLLGTQGLLLERQGKINATSYPKVRTGRLRSSITGAYNGRISNPEYRSKDRQEAIELLINTAEAICKKQDQLHMFSIGRNKHLIEIHKKLGWNIDSKPSYEIIKNI